MFRIDIQDHVRRLAREPWEDDHKEVERLCELIAPQFDILDAHQRLAGIDHFLPEVGEHEEDVVEFDHLDDEPQPVLPSHDPPADNAPMSSQAADLQFCPPERRRLSIPSTWASRANNYQAVELNL